MKKKNENELKAVSIMKRTCSDINQLYGELSAELSEEYLNDDNSKISTNIKTALEVINELHDEFLIKSKDAISALIKSENTNKESKSSLIEIEDCDPNKSLKDLHMQLEKNLTTCDFKDEDLKKDDIVIKPL
jgi:hypothetical protein